ncbi:Aste57867_11918 [Aphanomyces stellatus]|uniref:Aste57867_11918 protein n=1 Tax=Aphanomyces stellatus TaxID=120398 RepID=A0A485KU92_9STRA|nr:hypothetical protein As57867_011873 [Aphanomyces stellatus]VFT88773.1 Aste57867_11918 [Aphanomyces stellatus]
MEEVTISRPPKTSSVVNRAPVVADEARNTHYLSQGSRGEAVAVPHADEMRDDSLTRTNRAGSLSALDSVRRMSLPRETSRGSILMPRPSNHHLPTMHQQMPSSPSRFNSTRASSFFTRGSMYPGGDNESVLDTDQPYKEKMKLVNVATLKKAERAGDYKGQLRRWPGMIFLALLVIGAIAAITIGARKTYEASWSRTQIQMAEAHKRRAIQDGLEDGNLPVDIDGQVGNPKTYETTRRCALPDYQSKNGKLVAIGPNGTEVVLGIKGTNWFGMETGTKMPLGLWANDQNGTTVYEIASFLHRNKFNSIRLPICVQSLVNNVIPNKSLINLNANRAVNIGSYMDLLKSILKAMAYRDVTVLISMHTLTTKGATGSWFSADSPEADFMTAIDMLTKELCSDEYWNVIGIDLKNEPDDCGWGPTDKASAKCDWTVGAKKIGDRMHQGCRNWLAFVEGGASTLHKVGAISYFDWWGGRLQDAATVPIELQVANKLVWSPHYYTTAVAPQPYFYDKVVGSAAGGGFTSFVELSDEALRGIVHTTMEHMFGYLRDKRQYTIVVGEFGGLYAKDEHKGFTTRRTVDYTIQEMMQEGYSGGYMWSLNPESAYDWPYAGRKFPTAEGLLNDDWLTPNKLFMDAMAKMDALPNLRSFPCFTPVKKSN